MQPARIELMAGLPLTGSGKFDLRAAEALAREAPAVSGFAAREIGA
jgi:hypothetical protein